jgi:hypothetical protein
MLSGNRVEVLNHRPDRLAAQLGKNMPFVGEMLIDHGVRVANLSSDLAERHGLVAAIGNILLAAARISPRSLSLRSARRLGDVDVTSIAWSLSATLATNC